MDSILHDLRLGARALARTPGATALAVVTLALGIGANTAAFSLVYNVLLRPLPYHEPDRLVTVSSVGTDSGAEEGVSLADLGDARGATGAFAAAAAAQNRSFVVDAGGEPERVEGAAVTSDLAAVLGLTPALGRGIEPGEEDAALITDGYWRRRVGADPSVLGRRVVFDRRPVAIVGVLPERAQFPTRRVEMWLPLARARADSDRGDRSYTAVARLADGVTVDEARTRLGALAATLAAAYPETNASVRFEVARLDEAFVGKARERLLLLEGAVAFVLLIACANVANLQLAHATARTREIAIRAALGASRGRVVRQALAQSALVAVAGGAAGVLVASWLLGLLLSAAPEKFAGFESVGVDARMLAFAFAVSLATGLVSGLLPALHAAATDPAETLRKGASASAAATGRDRARSALLVTEVALSLVLLVGAGLLARAYVRLDEVAPGFDASRGLAVDDALPDASAPGREEVDAF
jgi:putative ABC transport system permease protein